MKRYSFLFSVCMIFIFPLNTDAQNNNSSIWETQNQALSANEYFIQHHQSLGLSSPKEMHLIKSNGVKNGWIHHKYQQQYKGLDVMTATYILHEKDGLVKNTNGRIFPGIDINISPAFNISSAEEIAENSVLVSLIEQNKIDTENYEDFTPLTSNKKLCIVDKSYPTVSGEYALAWIFDMDHQSWPPHNDRYIVDAHTGEILSNITLIHQAHIETEVATKYYGRRVIGMDSLGPDQFLLRNLTKGKGIFTEDGFGGDLYHSNDKNDWIKHEEEYETATDVHFCMEEFYDFLKVKFDRKSIDDEDFELRSIIHVRQDQSYVNAYWNGKRAHFGDGNCNDYSPLTTLDVVGHEFTHGMTQMTSGLIYRGESGGLNESISDIMGKMLEYHVTPNEFSWELGPAFIKSTDGRIFRSMKDPNLRNNPKYYLGKFWRDEVHNTSGVLNFWFYLICDGEKATNEKDYDYDVKAIGKEKALQIVYSMETNYLTASSSYQDAVEASIAATKELYGNIELESILEAWRAVGLEPRIEYDFDLSINIIDPIATGAGAESFCPIGNFYVTARIKNIGNNPILKGMKIPVKLVHDKKTISEQTIELDKDLATGEFVDILFDKYVSVEGLTNSRTNIIASLEIIDDNDINDISSKNISILIANVKGMDLSVQSMFGLRGGICVSEEKEDVSISYLALVRNLGCEIIEEGTLIEMDLDVNGTIIEYSIEMPRDLFPGLSEFLRVEFITEIGAGELVLNLTLDNDWDIRDANDNRSFTRFINKRIDEHYKEDFSTFDLLEQTRLAIVGGNMVKSVIDYRGNPMLGLTLDNDIDLDRLEDCDKFKRFYNSNRKTGSITWCVELDPQVKNPYFEFDMIQFSGDQTSFPSDKDYQTVASVRLPSDNTFETQYFYGQNQGELIHYKIALEQGYSGTLQMEYMMAYGTLEKMEQGKFDEIDAILLDNIQITGGIVGTDNETNLKNITVYPNPVSEHVNFRIDDDFKQYGVNIQILDMMGRVIHTGEYMSVDGYTWQTGSTQAGIYMYEMKSEGKIIGNGRIVVGK